MAAINWAYVAGVFDGEGHVSLQLGVDAIKPIVTVVQAGGTGHALLMAIQDFLGASNIRCRVYTHPPKGLQKQEWHELAFSGRKSVSIFAECVLPYLIMKKATMQDIARFLRIFSGRQGRGWR